MMGMLRRARKRRAAYQASCPCKQTCRCHTPDPDEMPAWAQYAFLGILAAIIPVTIIFSPNPKPTQRTIHVGTHVCPVVFVVTGQVCSGGRHNECHDVGYDDAQCD